MKVSFDFDGTLERESVQKYAKELINNGIEVWIVTSRLTTENYIKQYFTSQYNGELANKDLYDVAKELGIPESRIHFTNFQMKSDFLKDKNFVWHIDDDWCENRDILKNAQPTKAINAIGPNWKGKCEKVLKKYIKS